jgi:hypothetical protein
LPISLIKKKLESLSYKGAKLPIKVYSRDIKAFKYLAPAIPQRAALLSMLQITSMGIEAMFRNTLMFLSFQSFQAVRSSKDVRPFRRVAFAPEIAHHQA